MTAAMKWRYTADDLSSLSPFGSVLAERMPVMHYDGEWSEPKIIDVTDFRLHPGAHALHYGSSCFEGLKGYRWADDSVAVFRVDRHAERMVESARALRLPEPDAGVLSEMFCQAIRESVEWIPPAPGSLYVRPVLLGTDPNIGAASRPASQAVVYVLTSPVGDYFAGGDRALRLLVEDETPRTTPQFGRVKTGANYAAALGPTMDARNQYGIDQILFCPGGDVQETGASNFILIDDQRVVTKPLTNQFLHGVTRDSVLQIARDLGYQVEERDISLAELLDWSQTGEAALTGTAAVLTGVGTLIYQGKEYPVSGGETGSNSRKLRQALVEIQRGERPEPHGWVRKLV